MSTKQIVEDLLQKLPDSVSLQDIAREIEPSQCREGPR